MRKKAMAITDQEGNEFIKYKTLIEEAKPKKTSTTDLKELNNMVIKVQKIWRGYIVRKQYLKMMNSDLKKVG